MTGQSRGRRAQEAQSIKNVYGLLCMALSAYAVYGLYGMAKASPGDALIVAVCGLLFLITRIDVLMRFGKKHGKKY